MEIIKMEDWERRELFEVFGKSDWPFYFVSFDLDVTRVYEYAHDNHLSFYLTLTYLVSKAAASVHNFRYRIHGEEIHVLDTLKPSFTWLDEGSNVFKIVNCALEPTVKGFVRKASKLAKEQKSFLPEKDTEDLIFISSLPWIPTTAIGSEHNLDKNDYFPRISWGKYVGRSGHKVLNMSVDVNHRIIDGQHIGQFYEELCRQIESLGALEIKA